jgi:hypothetical protein
MSKLIGGNASLYINGTIYSSDGEFSANILTFKREAVVTAEGDVCYTEEPVPSTISGNLFLTDNLNPETVKNMVDGTVQIVLRTGKTVMLTQAFYSGDGAVDVKAGTMAVEFTGRGRHV